MLRTFAWHVIYAWSLVDRTRLYPSLYHSKEDAKKAVLPSGVPPFIAKEKKLLEEVAGRPVLKKILLDLYSRNF